MKANEISSSSYYWSIGLKMRDIKHFNGPISKFFSDIMGIKNKDLTKPKQALDLLVQQGYIKRDIKDLLWDDKKEFFIKKEESNKFYNKNADAIKKIGIDVNKQLRNRPIGNGDINKVISIVLDNIKGLNLDNINMSKLASEFGGHNIGKELIKSLGGVPSNIITKKNIKREIKAKFWKDINKIKPV